MGTEKELSELQRTYMDNDAIKEDRERVHESWFNEYTVDYWRHKRMYDTIQPLAKNYKESSWLTIGDGRFGLDSVRLKKIFGIINIFPTDIAGKMLEVSKQKGIIDQYKVENAEQLSFMDNAFDIVFCKEAFHHFPRPYLALYEMIRVAKFAVILVEPAEPLSTSSVKTNLYLKSTFQLILSKIFKKQFYPYLPPGNELNHVFEEAGNYLYAVSTRELEKIVYGMNLGGMAYKRFNDVYFKGCEFEKPVKGNVTFEKVLSELKQRDVLCRDHPEYHQPNMVSVVLFKKDINQALKKSILEDGFQIVRKLKNPYLHESFTCS